uniref:Uncharacterized protein n=1 Tax=Anguilla anguilla TaxID=7936 RepID=A0A0E9PXM6_ANGAN
MIANGVRELFTHVHSKDSMQETITQHVIVHPCD